jgi:hypothetical protein
MVAHRYLHHQLLHALVSGHKLGPTAGNSTSAELSYSRYLPPTLLLPSLHTWHPPHHSSPPLMATGLGIHTSHARACTAAGAEPAGGRARWCASSGACTCAWSLASSCIILASRWGVHRYGSHLSLTCRHGARWSQRWVIVREPRSRLLALTKG